MSNESIKLTSRTHKNTPQIAESQTEFVGFFQSVTILLSLAYLAVFSFLGSWVSFCAVLLFLISNLLSFRWMREGKLFLTRYVLAVGFSVTPPICVLFSGGAESPYLPWLVTPIFAVGALLTVQAIIIATVSVVSFYLSTLLFSAQILKINELQAGYNLELTALSVCSAALFLGLFAWRYNKSNAESTSRITHLVEGLQAAESSQKATNLRLSEQVEELAEMTRVFNLTQHIAQIGSFKTDLHTDQQWYTETLKSIFGYQPEEHFDRDIWLTHIHPEDADRLQAITAEIFANRNFIKQVLNYRIITKSGEVKHVEVIWDYVFDQGEDPKEIDGYLQDVSRVQAATQRERIARIELEGVARKRSQLFGMIAHELRTPVAAISMMADQKNQDE